jgi:hypothetical protein
VKFIPLNLTFPVEPWVLNELNTLIDNINTDSVTPDQLNGIVNDLGNVLLNAASSTFGQNQRRKKGNSVNNKCLHCLVYWTYYVKNIKKSVFDCVHLKTWG